MKKQRKHYTAEEKVTILRRRLVESVAVSDLCEELGLQPTVFCRWQMVAHSENEGNGDWYARTPFLAINPLVMKNAATVRKH